MTRCRFWYAYQLGDNKRYSFKLHGQFKQGLKVGDELQELFDGKQIVYRVVTVDYIISALIEKNENICPFKNYMAEPYCKRSIEKCETGLMIDCGEEPEFAWKEFIRINDDTM